MSRKPESNEWFDLSLLCQVGDLNMQRIAEASPSLLVGEYCENLSDFFTLAPEVLESLSKFAKYDADNLRHWRNIEAMIALLKDLGCDTCISDLYSISHARGKGDWRLAAHHASKTMDDFHSLCLRMTTAKRTSKRDTPPDAPGENDLSLTAHIAADATIPLCNYLQSIGKWVDARQTLVSSEDSQDQNTALSLNEYIRHLDDETADRKLSILAIDDSLVVLQSVASVLEGEYKVYTLPKPTELERVLQKLTPDLFLLDYNMPEINGFDLIPVIRSFEEHKDTPIIFLTSAGTSDKVRAALALGASDFAVKPFNPRMLREKVAKHIVKK